MPGYITKALDKFQHITPTQPQYVPQDWNAPAYGSRVQCDQTQSEVPNLDLVGKQ